MAIDLLKELQEKFTDINPVPMQGGGKAQPWTMAIYGQSAELELAELLYCFVRQIRPAIVAELGCHLGLTTYALGRACHDNGMGSVYSCDISEEYVAVARNRCLDLPVQIFCKSAENMSQVETADLLFIDCDYDNRIKAIERMKPGATGFLHDTRQEPILRDALDASGLQRLHFDTWRGFSMFQK